MSDTKEAVASQALTRLGEPGISSFTEDSDTAEKVNLLYEPTILALLSSYDWSFAKVKVALAEDGTGTPVNEWTRGFLMPALKSVRVGKPIAVYNSLSVGASPVFDFEIADKWIWTNQTTCVIDYIERKPESLWPGYFVTLAAEALASALALPVTENASKEQHHRAVAFGSPAQKGRGGLFGAAADADSTGNTTKSLLDDHDPMTEARFGGVF